MGLIYGITRQFYMKNDSYQSPANNGRVGVGLIGGNFMTNKIGIVYSPGYGAGWSTWGDPLMALDQELAHAIENKIERDELVNIAEKNWPDEYMGGLDDCKVEWVLPGTEFFIDEYDGFESITFREDGELWMVAK